MHARTSAKQGKKLANLLRKLRPEMEEKHQQHGILVLIGPSGLFAFLVILFSRGPKQKSKLGQVGLFWLTPKKLLTNANPNQGENPKDRSINGTKYQVLAWRQESKQETNLEVRRHGDQKKVRDQSTKHVVLVFQLLPLSSKHTLPDPASPHWGGDSEHLTSPLPARCLLHSVHRLRA